MKSSNFGLSTKCGQYFCGKHYSSHFVIFDVSSHKNIVPILWRVHTLWTSYKKNEKLNNSLSPQFMNCPQIVDCPQNTGAHLLIPLPCRCVEIWSEYILLLCSAKKKSSRLECKIKFICWEEKRSRIFKSLVGHLLSVLF
jgi:hypothetical protein